MMYNLTKIGMGNSTLELIQNVNSGLMGDWLGYIILAVIVVISYLSFIQSTGQPTKSFAGAMFAGFLSSLLLFSMKLLPVMAVWFTVVMLAVGIAFWSTD